MKPWVGEDERSTGPHLRAWVTTARDAVLWDYVVFARTHKHALRIARKLDLSDHIRVRRDRRFDGYAKALTVPGRALFEAGYAVPCSGHPCSRGFRLTRWRHTLVEHEGLVYCSQRCAEATAAHRARTDGAWRGARFMLAEYWPDVEFNGVSVLNGRIFALGCAPVESTGILRFEAGAVLCDPEDEAVVSAWLRSRGTSC